jgi:uncharacterized protein
MDLFGRPGALVGMVHLAPLPGSPRFGGIMEAIHQGAGRDAGVLAEAGFDAILVENYGDLPFYPDEVPAVTIAAMSAVIARLRRDLPGIPLGVNVLRNDARAALAIAAAAGGSFIRVNVHCGATATDQGILQGRAYETLRMRAAWAPGVAILADAFVKHGHPMAPTTLAEDVHDLVERGSADGVLVTGPRTGAAGSVAAVQEAVEAAGGAPVLVASGVSARNAAAYLAAGARGLIVGTAIKRGGRTEAPVDRARACELVRRVRELRGARKGGRTGGRAGVRP